MLSTVLSEQNQEALIGKKAVLNESGSDLLYSLQDNNLAFISNTSLYHQTSSIIFWNPTIKDDHYV